MLRIEAGTFWMGAADTDEDARANERPRHLVQISQPYLLGEAPVTQALYKAVVGETPSRFKERAGSDQRPVEGLSWFDAIAFCNKLSEMDGLKPAYIEAQKDRLHHVLLSLVPKHDVPLDMLVNFDETGNLLIPLPPGSD